MQGIPRLAEITVPLDLYAEKNKASGKIGICSAGAKLIDAVFKHHTDYPDGILQFGFQHATRNGIRVNDEGSSV